MAEPFMTREMLSVLEAANAWLQGQLVTARGEVGRIERLLREQEARIGAARRELAAREGKK